MTHPLPIRRPYGRINFGPRYQRRARYVWVPLRMLVLTRFLRRLLRRRGGGWWGGAVSAPETPPARETTDRPDIRESLARAAAMVDGTRLDELPSVYLSWADDLIAEMGRHGLVVVRASPGPSETVRHGRPAGVGAGDVVEPLEGPQTGAEGLPG